MRDDIRCPSRSKGHKKECGDKTNEMHEGIGYQTELGDCEVSESLAKLSLSFKS